MNFHPHKCKFVSVARHGYEVSEPIFPFQTFIYMLGDTILEYTDSANDLGVVVTSTMSWDDQCRTRYSICNSRLGMLKRVCHFTKNIKQKRALYLAIVRSQLDHCCVIWRPTSDAKINKLESVQK